MKRPGMGFGVAMLVGAVLLVGIAAILGGAIHLLASDTTDTNQDAADDAQTTQSEQEGTIQSAIDHALQQELESSGIFEGGSNSANSGTGGSGQSLTAPGSGLGAGTEYSFDVGFPTGQGQTTTVSSSSELESAVASASPGDVIQLQPGTYSGDISISNSGDVNKPIFITGAGSSPDQYPVIDGGYDPGDSGQCMQLNDADWIVIMNLRFKNCWHDVIVLDDTQYVTIHSVDMLSGNYGISAEGDNTHHTLIQNSHWKPRGEELWTDMSWSTGKSGSWDDKAGRTLYGVKPNGGSVIRGNEVEYAWNAYWDGFEGTTNMEFYGNYIHHIRDNFMEPESYVYNLHVYHNTFNQGDHSLLSISSVNGGLIYLYGNVGRYDLSDKSHTDRNRDRDGGRIFKMPSGKSSNIPSNNYLDEPLYAVHNSWYNYWTAFPNRYQKNVKHFNNAYNLHRGMGFGDWGSKWLKGQGNEFDYDVAANGWDSELDNNGHERNGHKNVDPQFRDPDNGDLRPQQGSPLIDAGTKVDGFPTTYNGKPDIGAYDNGELVAGPPFYIREPKGGLDYEEHPRITRHHVDGQTLTVYFSWPLDPGSVNARNIEIRRGGTSVSASQATLDQTGRKLTITANRDIDGSDNLNLCFTQMPTGTNGQQATYWASTIGCTT